MDTKRMYAIMDVYMIYIFIFVKDTTRIWDLE